MAIDIISLVERSQTDEVIERELVGPEPEELVGPEQQTDSILRTFENCFLCEQNTTYVLELTSYNF